MQFVALLKWNVVEFPIYLNRDPRAQSGTILFHVGVFIAYFEFDVLVECVN